MKEITYTIPEFLEIKRAEELYNKLGHKEKKLFQNVVVKGTAIALFLINHPSIVFANSALDKIDEIGFTFLTICRRLGYWILAIASIYELIQCARQHGNKQEIFEILMKYALLFSSLFLVTKVFDTIALYLS